MRITERKLRRIIREELLREEENPGSGMQAASARGNINTATADLTKTYAWFRDVVFPAVQDNEWPVVPDQDYIINYADDIRKPATKLNRHTPIIAKGTSYTSATDQKPMHYIDDGKPKQYSEKASLMDLYDMLERSVIFYKLNVPMESFPD